MRVSRCIPDMDAVHWNLAVRRYITIAPLYAQDVWMVYGEHRSLLRILCMAFQFFFFGGQTVRAAVNCTIWPYRLPFCGSRAECTMHVTY